MFINPKNISDHKNFHKSIKSVNIGICIPTLLESFGQKRCSLTIHVLISPNC